MQDPTPSETALEESVLRKTWHDVSQPFIDLFHSSRALWGINASYLLEGITYFGLLTLLAIFCNTAIGLNDIDAGHVVGVLTAGITLAMLFLGGAVDMLGARKALLAALGLMLVGRTLLTISPLTGTTGLWSSAYLVALFGIIWIMTGYGIYQPACYAAVKQFTTEKTAGMGYAMLYGIMNLGAFLSGVISPQVRGASGIAAVYWVYVGLTFAGILVIALVLTPRAVEAARAASGMQPERKEEKRSLREQAKFYMKNFPLKDTRFLFFIFILVPVQTLFAHNWLTLPQYCNRAFEGLVSNNFETFVNINPLLIFVLTPAAAAFTAKRNTYTMMIIGTLVMAAPTFLLTLGPNVVTLFAFLVLMTIGEAIWSPRFLQWVAEIAPEGMTGIYMGIGQFPWFLTKVVVSLYSGWFLTQYCPAGVPPSAMHTETMWFIYALIAMVSPIGLFLARKWMKKGFRLKHEG